MRTLYYFGIEPYEQRYTLQLTDWNVRAFKQRGINYHIVPGLTLDASKKIVVGQVLDAHGRSYYALSQVMHIIDLMRQGKINHQDVLYFEDMFHPGFESLGYVINQVDRANRPRIFVRCLAQTIDPDDFVHVWNMSSWMGHYEKMVNDIVAFSDGAILASNEEMVANMKIAGWTAPIYNVSGLAFDSNEVRSRIDNYREFTDRKMQVVFASRWDREKQPNFFMDIIDKWHATYPSKKVSFVVCAGGPLRSNDDSYMPRTEKMIESGKLTVYENLKKNAYYEILNNSRVLLNTALQDWTSNCVSEADALGCNVLYPAYRSFPEIFANDASRLYVPWSIDDAVEKLDTLLKKPSPNMGKISNWTSQTVSRIIDIIQGQGEEWNRTKNDYRKNVIGLVK